MILLLLSQVTFLCYVVLTVYRKESAMARLKRVERRVTQYRW